MAGYKIKGLANPSGGGQYRIKGLAQPQEEPQMDEQPMQSQQGIGSIPGDIGDMFANLFMGAGEKAMGFPEELEEAGKPFGEHPLKASARAGGNVLSSMLEGGKQLYNLPLNINTYLGGKGVPLFKQTMGLANKLKIGDTGLEKAVMGEPQKGDELFKDIGTVASLFAGPEVVGAKLPAITSKGITKQIVKTKLDRVAEAKKDYGSLFEKAADQGFTHAKIPKSVSASESHIVNHSEPRFHESLQTYIENPTLENAHWAQSELGALERHLDSISKKNGLTSSQIKTYKIVKQARKDIKGAMFPENAPSNAAKVQKHPESIFDTYESGDLFGVTANPEGTELANNLVGMAKKGDRAIVIDAKVKNQGQGLGKDLYRKAIETAQKKGLKFESDDVVSQSAMNVYKSLEKEGYKFKFNPDVEKFTREDGQIAYRAKNDDQAVVKLVSTPEKVKIPESKIQNQNKLRAEYDELAAKYKEKVVPYTSLEDIHEYQQGKMRPKTVVKNLQNDEEFMTKLAKEYPGLKLHTPRAKQIMLGLAGLVGYDELKKLLKSF